jgi:hypothetical protein
MPEGERDIMTRDDIIRLTQEAGLYLATDVHWMPIIGLEYAEKFAALVAVQVEATWQNRYLKLMDLMKAREGQPNKPCCLAEREACAKVCDEEGLHITASIIRARGQE